MDPAEHQEAFGGELGKFWESQPHGVLCILGHQTPATKESHKSKLLEGGEGMTSQGSSGSLNPLQKVVMQRVTMNQK